MCKIISISGSHGVGKTSLLKLIVKDSNLSEEQVKFFNEFNTGFFNMGFAFNCDGHDFDEVIFSQSKAFDLGYETIKYYLTRKEDRRIIITDRSCLDTYVYTDYFLSKNQDKAGRYINLIEDMKAKSKEILEHVKHVFLPPFQDFENLEDRMSLSSRDEIWNSFKDKFLINKHNNILVLQSDTTAERCKEITDLITLLHNRK